METPFKLKELDSMSIQRNLEPLLKKRMSRKSHGETTPSPKTKVPKEPQAPARKREAKDSRKRVKAVTPPTFS